MAGKSTIPPKEDKKWWMWVELSKMVVIEKIASHLMHGLTIKKACNAHNVQTMWKDYISPLTVATWYQDHSEVSEYIDALRESWEVLAHKNWIDNIRDGNFQAAREWLKVKDKENYWDAFDTSPKVIIEFATSPSPFITQNPSPVDIPVPPEFPQSQAFKNKDIKKKPENTPGKKPSGTTAKTTKKPKKKSGNTEKGCTTPKKSSKEK